MSTEFERMKFELSLYKDSLLMELNKSIKDFILIDIMDWFDENRETTYFISSENGFYYFTDAFEAAKYAATIKFPILFKCTNINGQKRMESSFV